MKTWKWVAHGLDMRLDYVIVETEGENVYESNQKAIDMLIEMGMDFDCIERFNRRFVNEVIFKECEQ